MNARLTDCKRPACKKIDKIIARNFDFSNNQKNTNEQKRWRCKDKTQTNQNKVFQKPDITKK
ncbi:MAG: hypothetical protein AUK01_12485 [Anaerolineae bacterium CG2_30_57_67]|nr:MAG: hypothetical protein AUK01_12485 [Anaerolineae bacterium CG2_30_57_67]